MLWYVMVCYGMIWCAGAMLRYAMDAFVMLWCGMGIVWYGYVWHYLVMLD